MSVNAIMSIMPQGDDLVCILDDGQRLVVDWRQAWTYRRVEDGDDALAIARRAYEQAPDLFSPARLPDLADRQPRLRSFPVPVRVASRIGRAAAQILASILRTRNADEKK